MGSIRFLLAVAVVLVHSSSIFGITLIPGYLAVQSFYIISGFLMALVYSEKYSKTNRPYYFFISNRILRLYPTYILVVILTIFLSLILGLVFNSYGKLQFYLNVYQSSPQSFYSLVIVFVSNFILVGQDFISFFGIDKQSGGFYFLGLQSDMVLQDLLLIQIAWTVAVEFFFYLLTPFIVNRSIYKILMAIFMVLVLRYSLFYFGYTDDRFAIYRFAPTELFWFLLGVLAYRLKTLGFIFFENFGVIFLVWILLFAGCYEFILFKYKDVAFFASIFLGCSPLLKYFENFKFDKFFGDLCYPLYLSHCMVLLVVGPESFPKPFGEGLPTLTISIIFSIFINIFFLLPLERYRQKRVIFTSA